MSRCRGDAPTFVATTMGWCEGLDLFYDGLARIYLVDYSKETSQFCLVAWHWFQLLNKVVSHYSYSITRSENEKEES